jgi:ethanolamine utilization protein EutA (predicted chaperonin)
MKQFDLDKKKKRFSLGINVTENTFYNKVLMVSEAIVAMSAEQRQLTMSCGYL